MTTNSAQIDVAGLREADEMFLVRHQGDGADARLIQGRVQMAAHVRNMTVGSDDLEDVAEAGMTEHLRVLLDANDAEWAEHGEPACYSMDFEDGAITVYLVTSTADTTPSAPAQSVDALREARDALKIAREFIENGIEMGFIRLPDEYSGDPAHKTPGIVRAAIARADAALTVAPPAEGWRTPKGWKLVPIEPDDAMIAAAHKAVVRHLRRDAKTSAQREAMFGGIKPNGSRLSQCEKHRARYKAMVAAAPGAPS